jgi:HEAT repeat protein
MGEAAKPAVSEIANLLGDPEPSVRTTAGQALKKIDAETPK